MLNKPMKMTCLPKRHMSIIPHEERHVGVGEAGWWLRSFSVKIVENFYSSLKSIHIVELSTKYTNSSIFVSVSIF